MATDTSVVAFIPTLGRNPDRLLRAVSSVLAGKHSNLTLVVVDNSSAGLVADLSGVEIISTGVNLGMVGAMQIVTQRYPADFIWSLQDDMVLLNDCLTPMLQEMTARPVVGACTPVLDHDGIQPAHLRAGFIESVDSDVLQWRLFPEHPTPLVELDVDHEFTFVFSSGTLYRSTALQDIGGVDVGLWPLTHVDVDIGLRMSKRGWKSIICTEARAWHAKGQSTSRTLGRVTSDWNRKRILEDFDARTAETGLGFGPWDPMIARMSHLTIEMGREQDLRSAWPTGGLWKKFMRRVKSAFKKLMALGR